MLIFSTLMFFLFLFFLDSFYLINYIKFSAAGTMSINIEIAITLKQQYAINLPIVLRLLTKLFVFALSVSVFS